MNRLLALSLVACAAIAAVACGQGASRGAAEAEHPAEVRPEPDEAELTTITLTERAVQRLGIETTPVERKSIRQTRTFGGELVVPPGRSVTVTAPVAGRLTGPADGPLPAPGTLLRQDQEVLRLLPIGPPENDLVQREAAALARFEAASTAARRTEQLLRDRAGSQKQMEEARAELAIAEATLQTVRNQRSALGGDGLGAWSMKSPLTGRLGKIYVAVGQTATPSLPLFEVTAEHPLWVRVPVYVGDLPSIDRVQAATIQELGASASWNPSVRDAAPSRTATLVPSPPSGNPEAATVNLIFSLDNSDRAYQPGQKVAVTMALASTGGGEDSLVVPYSAVLYDIHGGTWVYRNTTPRQYVRQRVELDRVVADQVVLTRGPAPGTPVVSVGAAELFGTEFGVGH